MNAVPDSVISILLQTRPAGARPHYGSTNGHSITGNSRRNSIESRGPADRYRMPPHRSSIPASHALVSWQLG
jgi:hypothetical protein